MKRTGVLLAAFLLLLPAVLITYRVVSLGYPLFPAAPEKIWQLSMETHITKTGNNESRVMIGLPYTFTGRMGFEERIIRGDLDFSLIRKGPNRFGVWSGIVGPEGETIGYRVTIPARLESTFKTPLPELKPYPENVERTEQALAEQLIQKWRELPPPARLRAIASAVAGDWGESPPSSEYLKEWMILQKKHGQITSLLVLLRSANLPVRINEGLLLVEGITTRTITWLEVWTGKTWERLQPETGEIYSKSVLLLPLTTGGFPAISVFNSDLSEIRWTLSKKIISQWRLHFERIRQSDQFFDRWSLLRLPPEFQGTFRILILVPIGALLIGVLRNVAGFPTFGVFMPVLMALAFRNTGLLYGLGIFAYVILIGYVIRRLIDGLHLLLVPRLSVILTVVIGCFTIFALLGNKLGLQQLMAVGLLPFVILTMTIERFFVITEEEGLNKAIRTAAGSAIVATITYQIINWEPLQLTFFIYPELLLAVAAFQILLGRYTGYRISELIRFRKLRGSS